MMTRRERHNAVVAGELTVATEIVKEWNDRAHADEETYIKVVQLMQDTYPLFHWDYAEGKVTVTHRGEM